MAEWLLRTVVRSGVVGESIMGDAREEHAEYVRTGGLAPGVWYWLHTLRLLAGYAITRGGDVEMGTLLKNLKFGARALSRMPGSALVAVVVLAIGIGLCSFMFSLIYGVYFRGLAVPDAEEVLVVFGTNPELDQDTRNISLQDFVDFRERQRSFSGLAGHYLGTVNVSGPEGPRRFDGAFVSANTFSVLGVNPLLGRGFAEGENVPGAPLNVVLGYGAWMREYGGDPSVVGRQVRVNGEAGSILGVMPEGFDFPSLREAWIPMRDNPLTGQRGQGRYLTVHGRLAEGVTFEQAEAEMAGIAARLASEYPESNEGIGVQLDTTVEAATSEELNAIFGAMVFAVLCVLLVACANVASLLLARAAMRTKEAGIRVAMGGGRFRVMLPFFAEALVLACAGAVVGLGIAYVGVGWFDRVTDPALTGRPTFMRFALDGPIAAFVVGLTGLTALVAGVAPAWQMSRTDVNEVLKDESRGSSGLRIGRLSRWLVTAEVALSCALLVGAGLMTKSMLNVQEIEYPYETDGLFTARLGIFVADYPDREARQELWEDVRRELQAHPRIASAALTSNLPHNGNAQNRIAVEGAEFERESELPIALRVVVSTDFFSTLGTPIESGRDFIDQDDLGSALVAIVNQPMVERHFGGDDPIGRRFRERADDTAPLLTVVGVVPDMYMQGSVPPGFPGFEPSAYYVPLNQADARFLSVAAMPASGGEALSITSDVRSTVRAIDGDLPIYEIFTQAEVIHRRVWFFEVFGTVFIVFGIAALFMASAGLYGVLSFAVTRRTQEMGIRMALGAGARDVVRLVARQGASQLGIGLVLGLALAFGLTRLIGIVMYEVDPQDPLVFAGVVGVIAVVGTAAAIFPALRATGVDPVEALRAE